MIIPPPRDSDFAVEEVLSPKEITDEEYYRIREYLNVKSWICSACGLTNFGRNRQCANFNCQAPRK